MNDLALLILSSLATSIQIVFIHVLFWDGMIFEFMKENKLNTFVQKPLYSCLICMTSVWGSLLWIFEWQGSIPFIQFLFTVGGINVLIYGIVGRAEDANGEQFVDDNKTA